MPNTWSLAAIPARLAGVREIALVTPPRADGSVPAPVLAAAAIAGVDEVYRLGGAQAIAALALGTDQVPRVDVVVGPGNVYVTLAKREVFGEKKPLWESSEASPVPDYDPGQVVALKTGLLQTLRNASNNPSIAPHRRPTSWR